MARTVRRQPFSVSTKSSDYPTTQIFAQSAFSGIDENENQMTVDQNSFAKAENVYIDRDGALVNRPPFVNTNVRNVVKTWRFGSHMLGMTKYLCYRSNETDLAGDYVYVRIDAPGDHIESDLYFEYQLIYLSGQAIDDPSTNRYSSKTWRLPTTTEPKFACAELSGDIFCWFNGIDIVLFDVDLAGAGYFTDGRPRLYYPVREIVMNGLTSTGEGRNLFTNGYRRRYIRSTVSQVDFRELDQYVTTSYVNANYYDKNGSSVPLDKIRVKSLAASDGRTLIHPKQPLIQDYLFTTRMTNRGQVILRYTRDTKYLSVSFAFGPYYTLPSLDDIAGEPTLTDDGFYAVAFTTKGIAFCELVKTDTEVSDSDFTWKFEPYADGVTFKNDLAKRICTGHFISRENYAYVAPHDGSSYFHVEANGISKNMHMDAINSFRVQQIRVWLDITPNGQVQAILVRNTGTAPKAVGELRYIFYDEYGEKKNYVKLQEIDRDTVFHKNFPSPFSNLFGAHAEISVVKSEQANNYIRNIVLHLSEDGTATKYTVTIDGAASFTRESLGEDMLYWLPVHGTNDVFTEEQYLPGGDFYDSINIDEIPAPTRALQNGDGVRIGDKYVRLFNVGGNGLGKGELRAGNIITAPITCRTEKEILNLPIIESNRWRLEKIDTSTTGFYFGEEVKLVGQSSGDVPAGETFTARLQFHEWSYVPLFGTADGIWYSTPGGIWTSALEEGERIEIDTRLYTNEITGLVPEFVAPLDDIYFSFTQNGKSALGVTSPRRDDTSQNDLLYADADEVQSFGHAIANLHPLSDDTLGIFTEDEVWYVTRQVDDNNSVLHARPVRSRIPFGCKRGADVITAFDGQAIIFATARGIVALAPQDFVATTDKSLTFLSDKIDKTYQAFFNNQVKTVDGRTIDASVKIYAYQHWLIFYRYMDRELLLLDTRNSSWWKWTAPYPIREVATVTSTEFLVLFDIVFPERGTHATDLHKAYFGVYFSLDFDGDKNIYEDDIIANALTGDYEYLYANDRFAPRLVQYKGDPTINWSFTSQRLHLNAPQNYKGIKSLYLNVRGDSAMHAKFITKVYRDTFHPKREETQEILVNEARTFIKHVNFLHVTNFQYTIMNGELNKRLRLDSLGVKYEVKEKLR